MFLKIVIEEFKCQFKLFYFMSGEQLSVDYKILLIYGTDSMMLIPEVTKQHEVFAFTLILLEYSRATGCVMF